MWKLLAFLIIAEVFITACTIAGIDGKKTPNKFVPCISLKDPGDPEPCGCRADTVSVTDTAAYRNAYFERHKTTGRSFWKPVE